MDVIYFWGGLLLICAYVFGLGFLDLDFWILDIGVLPPFWRRLIYKGILGVEAHADHRRGGYYRERYLHHSVWCFVFSLSEFA